MPEVNPCTFKTVCRTCKLVSNIPDRPALCKALVCEQYTPCASCEKNVPLYRDKKCADCSKKPGPKTGPQPKPEPLHETFTSFPTQVTANGSTVALIEPRKFSVTVPGQPPPEYNDEEKSYYYELWKEFEGYYRDPTAYPICHQLILSTIEMNHVGTMLIQERMSDDEAKMERLERRRTRLIDDIAKLHSQLPEKEAVEITEQEKSIAGIYQRYAAEMLTHRVGKTTRILSPEAVALAPALYFKPNLADILQRLGYESASIERALNQAIDVTHLPKDPVHFLEAIGILLDEKVVRLEPTEEVSNFPQENADASTSDNTEDFSAN